MFRTLRQPRYAMLGALMLIVAIACVAAGTWQIVRFEDKRLENDHLRTNADLATADVAKVLPVVGQATAFDTTGPDPSPFDEPSAHDVRAAKLSDRYGKLVR